MYSSGFTFKLILTLREAKVMVEVQSAKKHEVENKDILSLIKSLFSQNVLSFQLLK